VNEDGEIDSVSRSAGSGVHGEKAGAAAALEHARTRGPHDGNSSRTTMADQPQTGAGKHRLEVGISHQSVWGEDWERRHRVVCSSPPPSSKLLGSSWVRYPSPMSRSLGR